MNRTPRLIQNQSNNDETHIDEGMFRVAFCMIGYAKGRVLTSKTHETIKFSVTLKSAEDPIPKKPGDFSGKKVEQDINPSAFWILFPEIALSGENIVRVNVNFHSVDKVHSQVFQSAIMDAISMQQNVEGKMVTMQVYFISYNLYVRYISLIYICVCSVLSMTLT